MSELETVLANRCGLLDRQISEMKRAGFLTSTSPTAPQGSKATSAMWYDISDDGDHNVQCIKPQQVNLDDFGIAFVGIKCQQ